MSINQTLSGSESQSPSSDASQIRRLVVQSFACLGFGLIMLFAVGFAPVDVAHNAAHDSRHSAAFPCH